jgi:hypothetical protein
MIVPSQLGATEALARDGNCEAALKIARYHTNITLKFDAAIAWYRIATGLCQANGPKEELVALLIGNYDEPSEAAEINGLIVAIERTDPSVALKLKAEVRRHAAKNPL